MRYQKSGPQLASELSKCPQEVEALLKMSLNNKCHVFVKFCPLIKYIFLLQIHSGGVKKASDLLNLTVHSAGVKMSRQETKVEVAEVQMFTGWRGSGMRTLEGQKMLDVLERKSD